MSISQRMDIEIVVHLHNGNCVISAIKNKGIMKATGKWMEVENVILSEVTQTKNGMHKKNLV